MTDSAPIRILFCADTHLGFDLPLRARVERRHRGPDFFASFQRVLDRARGCRADLLVHGGDLFFRSRVPAAIVDRAYAMLDRLASDGVPIVIVPGNHERSNLPVSLWLSHPRIHVLAGPRTIVFDVGGMRVAVAGFPSVREGVGPRFPSLLAATGWRETEADLRLLVLHQTIEGAQVGPADYTFRHGADVIPRSELPPEFDAVLAGHIHRAQMLRRPRPDGSFLPVVYSGSTERTSFAERLEPKGFYVIEAIPGRDRGRAGLAFEFVSLPARPMVEILLVPGLPPGELPAFLAACAAEIDPDAVVRLRCAGDVPDETLRLLTSRLLRQVLPPTMSVAVSGGLFARSARGGA